MNRLRWSRFFICWCFLLLVLSEQLLTTEAQTATPTATPTVTRTSTVTPTPTATPHFWNSITGTPEHDYDLCPDAYVNLDTVSGEWASQCSFCNERYVTDNELQPELADFTGLNPIPNFQLSTGATITPTFTVTPTLTRTPTAGPTATFTATNTPAPAPYTWSTDFTTPNRPYQTIYTAANVGTLGTSGDANDGLAVYNGNDVYDNAMSNYSQGYSFVTDVIFTSVGLTSFDGLGLVYTRTGGSGGTVSASYVQVFVNGHTSPDLEIYHGAGYTTSGTPKTQNETFTRISGVSTVRIKIRFSSSSNSGNLRWHSMSLTESAYSSPTPTPSPTGTVTPTPVVSPTLMGSGLGIIAPTASAPFDCSEPDVVDYAENPVAGFSGYDDLYEETDCFTVVPGLFIDPPDFLFGDLDNIILDQVDLCVEFYNFPTINILGIVISLDFFLVLPIGWLVRRLFNF